MRSTNRTAWSYNNARGGHSTKTHGSSAYTYLTTRGNPLTMSLLVGGALLAVWKMSSAPVTERPGN
jgi:hypothetical protein